MNSADTVIAVEQVTKSFRLLGGGLTLKSVLLDRLRGRKTPRFEALKDITFSVNRGETLGIVGANGAGKSTLLALIAGTIEPNAGAILTRGTIASLLELGAGFHPELTGRENIFLYGAIMGIPRRRMRERFDAIVEFSGIEEFIDQPVKHYSSGMYVRLGFAVAVEVDPDILLIDEVLAVGDESFQRKCMAKIHDFHERGKTMLIISHDLSTITEVSDRILFLDQGELKGLGNPEGMIRRYRGAVGERRSRGLKREWGTGEVTLKNLSVRTEQGHPLREPLRAGDGLQLRFEYSAARKIDRPIFGFSLEDSDGRLLHGSNTGMAGLEIDAIEGRGKITLALPSLSLGTGSYLLSVSVHSWDHSEHYHRLDHAVGFALENPREFDGALDLESRWNLEKNPS